MRWLYYNLPTWLIGVLIIGGFVTVSVLGLLLFRRFTEKRLFLNEEMNNDIIFFASAIGVFYSLMAGLMSVAVWGNYASVQDVVSQEASSLGALYRDVTSLPEPARSELQQQLREYNAFLIEQTWPAQRRGLILDETTRRVNRFAVRLPLARHLALVGHWVVRPEAPQPATAPRPWAIARASTRSRPAAWATRAHVRRDLARRS